MKGREKSGVVRGEEYASMVHELKTRLLQIHDPENQRPVVSSVHHRDELYCGPRTNESPDLIVVPEQGYAYHEGFSDKLLRPFLWHRRDISGGHRREGIFIESGPDLKKLEEPIEVTILDILPTILYLNRLPIPRHTNGAVITSIIQQNFQEESPIEYTDKYELLTSRSSGYSDDEEAIIEEHLRALGYL